MEHPRTVGQYQMVEHKGNLRPRRKGKRKQGQICILKEMMTENFPLIKNNKL